MRAYGAGFCLGVIMQIALFVAWWLWLFPIYIRWATQ